MRILSQKIECTGDGSVTVKIENVDDLWYAHNLIAHGDIVKAPTFRKIKEESKTGSVITTKRKITLFLAVKSIEYDPESNKIRVSGVCAVENNLVQKNQHHTMELGTHSPFTLIKKYWDPLYLETLREACDPSQDASVAALVMEEGLANLCLITNHATIVKVRVEGQIPRKRKGADNHGKALLKFFEKCSNAVSQHINFENIKCMVIASPGFVKDQFAEYLEANKPTWFNRDMTLFAHSSSGEKNALVGTLSEPSVKEKLESLQFNRDLEVIDEFFRVLSVDPYKAVYSMIDVETACSQKAIDKLIVSDSTLKTRRLAERRRIVSLVQMARDYGAAVLTVSSSHVAGERLQQLSGIAALLRFPVYDLNDMGDVSEEEKAEEEDLDVNIEELKIEDDDDDSWEAL